MAKKITTSLLIVFTLIFFVSCSKDLKLVYQCGEQFRIKSGYEFVSVYPQLIFHNDYEYVIKRFSVCDKHGFSFDIYVDDQNFIRMIKNMPPNVFKVQNSFCVPEGYNVYSTLNDFASEDFVSVETIPFVGKLFELKSGFCVSFSVNDTDNELDSVKFKALTQIYKIDKSYFYLLEEKFEKNYFSESFLQERENSLVQSIKEDKKEFLNRN